MEPLSRKETSGLEIFGSLAALVVVVAGLKAMANVLIPLAFALFLAAIGSVPLNWLLKKKMPRLLATLVVFVGVMAGFLVAFVVLANSVNSFVAEIAIYQSRLESIESSFSRFLDNFGIVQPPREMFKSIQPQSVFNFFGLALSSLATLMSQSLVVSIYVVFLLLEASVLRKKVQAFSATPYEETSIGKVAADTQRYMAVKTAVNAAWGGLIAFVAAVLGLKFALLWGLITFFFCFVPVIGAIVSVVPAVLFAFLDLGAWSALIVCSGFMIIHLVMGNFVEPFFIGKQLDISPFVALVALAFWGWVWGLSGMLLSVPLTIFIRIWCAHTPDLQWISVFMGAGGPAESRANKKNLQLASSNPNT